MKRILTALTLSAVLASPAWSGDILVAGNGLATCAKMTQEHDRFEGSRNVSTYEQWILGYVAGMNRAKGTMAGKSKSEAFYAAALKYCRENPLEEFFWAAEDVYRQLD